LFWLARQQVYVLFRRQARHPEVGPEEDAHDGGDDGPRRLVDERSSDPFLEAVRREDEDLVRRTIRRLPARDGEVLVLHYIEGQNCEQIGVIVNRPKGTVMRWLAEAREKFVRETPKARAEAAREALIRLQPRDRLEDAIGRLPEGLGGVAWLYYIEGLAAEEVAEQVNLPAESVCERLAGASEALAAALGDQAA
jgi:DNA-directed RNA polymerase specialized sigma24 family protein